MFNKNAVQLSKLNTHLLERLAARPSPSDADFELVVMEALSLQSSDLAAEVSFLESQLEQMRQSIEPLEALRQECQEQGRAQARRWVNSFAAILLSQFMLTQYGTYVAFSWDIVEPLTCVMSFSDACLGYLFWLQTGKPWDVAGLAAHFEARKMRRAVKRARLDIAKYETTREAIRLVEARLAELKQ
uniref:Calcium uniporter protein C-terminal domain-containing protein n=1 Tax=Strombidium rassoulzadegani TaxID=1082188 RepID=A0A7S3CPW2_9SPIT|mmetsp:Transcript_2056/g.3633  ORF Transcript_2056/g.3633 Transcript_2056/m.3633 type:complete len:187 (+) Transcript_2056:582-1142(+)